MENWSLVLNILLLIGVLVAIGSLLKAKKRESNPDRFKPSLGPTSSASAREVNSYPDDIISVRQIVREESIDEQYEPELKVVKKTTIKPQQPKLIPQVEAKPVPTLKAAPKVSAGSQTTGDSSLMMFLLAKDNRQFAGYELLQTVLAAGLRFGEGQLFHRHQFSNGHGPVLCSLASATASGVFDLQNIGAFSVRGLCLFMHASKNPSIDAERFSIMLETARQLSEGLDAHLLDENRQPLTEERIGRYYNSLNIEPLELEFETAS